MSRVLLLFFVLSAILLPGAAVPSATMAASGIAITGSFYRQPFEIPQGSSVAGPSVYVIVSNEGTEAFGVRMVTRAVTTDNVPVSGISVNLSSVSFSLAAHAELKIFITVEVADTVPEGQYDISVTAESLKEDGDPLTISGSAGQKASLTVTGDSASVMVNTVGPSKQPVVAQIRLFRVVAGEGYEVAFSNTGSLEAKVAPGTFRAEAYSLTTSDPLCDPRTFDVAANDTITVDLEVRMVYFENDFVVIANYDSETKELLNARTLATLTNVFDTLPNTEVRLATTFNGDPLEEITVLGPLSLPVGQTGVPWNYIPADGWKSGLYGFKYQLYVSGALTAETTGQTLKVGGGGVASWLWIVFVILGVLGAAGLGFLIFFLVKRRREQEEKPRKAEKKRKEERPARKAEEPVRKPEPYRPPEPARPVPGEEPIVQPSPLASVSSLKARMASLGRDQGTGKPAEEEPGAEDQDKPVETSTQPRAVGPLPPPAKIEPERPAVKKAEEKGPKPPPIVKPPAQKPGIFSKVTATGKHEPPKPPSAKGPTPAKPDSDVQISWPPKHVEPPKPPSDVQISWPPKPVEPPKPPSDVQINWPPITVEPARPPKPESDVQISWPPKSVEPPKPPAAQPEVEPAAPAPAPPEATPTEEAAPEEPTEPEAPPTRSSFAEAARLRMEARQRASEKGKPGAEPEQPQIEGDAGEPGEGGERPPSP